MVVRIVHAARRGRGLHRPRLVCQRRLRPSLNGSEHEAQALARRPDGPAAERDPSISCVEAFVE